MKTVTPIKYYNLGSILRYLLDAKQGWRVKGDIFIYSNLKALITGVDELQLPVSAMGLRTLRNLEVQLKAVPDGEKLTLEQQKALNTAARGFREVIAAELRSLIVYTLVPKRYPSDVLLSKVGTLLAANIFSSLTTIAQFDLEEAGKCIAFERPTAAAFHILRATEATLKDFYLHSVKHKRTKHLMMGPIIADMRIKRKTKHLTDLIACLDNIRNSYRNPTQHPEKAYDLDQVQDLLSICFDAITKLSKAKAVM